MDWFMEPNVIHHEDVIDSVENSKNKSIETLNYAARESNSPSRNNINFKITLNNTNYIPEFHIQRRNIVSDVKTRNKDSISFSEKYSKFMKEMKRKRKMNIKDEKIVIPWNASAFWKRRDNGILIEMERLLHVWIVRHRHTELNDNIVSEKSKEIFLDLKNKSGTIFELVEFNPDDQWLNNFKKKFFPKRKLKETWNLSKNEKDENAVKKSLEEQKRVKRTRKINIKYDKQLLRANYVRLSSFVKELEGTRSRFEAQDPLLTSIPIVKLVRINMNEMKKIYRIDSDHNDILSFDDDVHVNEVKIEWSPHSEIESDTSGNVPLITNSDHNYNLNTDTEKIEIPLENDNQPAVNDNIPLKKSSDHDNKSLSDNDKNTDKVKIQSFPESVDQTRVKDNIQAKNNSDHNYILLSDDDINIDKVKIELSVESDNQNLVNDNIPLDKSPGDHMKSLSDNDINIGKVKIEPSLESDNQTLVKDNIQSKTNSDHNYTLLPEDGINIDNVRIKPLPESNNQTLVNENILSKENSNHSNVLLSDDKVYEMEIEYIPDSINENSISNHVSLKESDNNLNDNLNNKKEQQVSEDNLEKNACKKNSETVNESVHKSQERMNNGTFINMTEVFKPKTNHKIIVKNNTINIKLMPEKRVLDKNTVTSNNSKILKTYSRKTKSTIEKEITQPKHTEPSFFDSIKPHIEKLERIAGLNFYSHLWDEMR